ncbi:MAG: winged helix-turn-helix domain-containing protein [Nitrososphaerales archaeon]
MYTTDLDSLIHHRKRRGIRPQKEIVAAILDACRTPTVEHWILVKARLGYATLWKHMSKLVSLGMLNETYEGKKTLYTINEKGLELLNQIEDGASVRTSGELKFLFSRRRMQQE